MQFLSSTINKINTHTPPSPPQPLWGYILYNVSNYYADGSNEDTKSEDHKMQLMKKQRTQKRKDKLSIRMDVSKCHQRTIGRLSLIF